MTDHPDTSRESALVERPLILVEDEAAVVFGGVSRQGKTDAAALVDRLLRMGREVR